MAKRQSRSRNRSSSNRESNEKQVSNASVTNNKNQSGEKPDTNKDGDQSSGKQDKYANDPAWYARDPYIARDAGTFYFSYAFGKHYKLNVLASHTVNTSGNLPGAIDVPGILCLRTKPTFGFSDSPISPLNVAANGLYGYVRHLNAGRKNYDPSDLFIYLTAIANIDSAIVWAERIYSMAMTYADQNRYIGDALLMSQGVDATEFRSNLADFRMRLNAFINKMSVYAVPKDITYFNKVCFMYRDIYLENGEGNIKDQMYMYVPDGFYFFNRDADNIGMLDYSYWKFGTGNWAKHTDIIDYLEGLAANLFGDEDSSLMSGDIFKVYGENILRLVSMDEALALPLVYDPMVLWQMKNSYSLPLQRRSNAEGNTNLPSDRQKTVHSEYSLGSGRNQNGRPGCVFQRSDGVLMSVERLVDASASSGTTYTTNNYTSYLVAVDKLLSSEVANPDVGIVLESSRNIIGPNDAVDGYTGTETNKNIGWITCGSFVVVSLDSISMTNSGSPYLMHISQYQGYTTSAARNEIMYRYIPTLFMHASDQSNNVTDFWPCTDINNYVILDQASIAKLHDAALLSLLYVPGIAKIS